MYKGYVAVGVGMKLKTDNVIHNETNSSNFSSEFKGTEMATVNLRLVGLGIR